MKPVHLQKATKFNTSKHSNKIRGWGIQRKIDGVRVQTIIENGEVSIFAKSPADKSNEFNNYTAHLPHVVEYLETLNLPDMHIDGEACVFIHDKDDMNCRYVAGTLNMLPENALVKQAENELIRIVLFDAPFLTGKYKERYAFLTEHFNINTGFRTDKTMVTVNPMTINRDTEYLEEYNRIIDEYGEGIVLYNMDAVYKHAKKEPFRCQKSQDLLKIKEVNEKEVLAIGREKGIESGWCSDIVGALICEDERGKVFRVGSGMDAEMRAYLQTVELPCIIEITYNAMTEESYRLPIFRRLRTDKDINDWTKEGEDDNETLVAVKT